MSLRSIMSSLPSSGGETNIVLNRIMMSTTNKLSIKYCKTIWAMGVRKSPALVTGTRKAICIGM